MSPGRGIPVRVRAWLPEIAISLIVALPVLLLGGRTLNSDTKLYLTTDPGGLMDRATQAWDASQFAGYVPHQAIAYLWPTGPFHWFARTLGMAPWVAQRLFVALVFVTAAVGACRFLRRVGAGAPAAFAGALSYAVSPYVMAYQSRTSSMLLPWAILGWACLFALRGREDPSWRWPAGLALLLGTAGAVNGTAALLVLPAIALVALVPTEADGSRRRATGLIFLLRGGLLTLGASAWWMIAILVQGRHGADVLAYSETLEDVSSTSSAFEVLRGFGYWLNYVGLDSIPATTAVQTTIASRLALAATLVVPILGLVGLVMAPPARARMAGAMVLAGAVIAVGVHPLGAPAPWARPLADNPDGWLSLALRSSTRALPVLLLGLAVGVAALVDAVGRVRLVRHGPFPAAPGALAAVVAMSVLFAQPSRLTDGVVDPALSRPPEAPAHWQTAVRLAEDISAESSRILQLPGQEFGAHSWGFTLDPVVPSLTDRQFLVRDLLPLGSPQTMDLLWALDEAGRDGALSADALAEVNRLLGVGAVLVPGDLDLARYTTPDIATFLSDNALEDAAITTGPHRVIPGASSNSILRQQRGSIVLAGSGKGVVDAAGRGLTGQATLLYAADIDDVALRTAIADSAGLVVTDTNTATARHWRGTRDTVGYPESLDGATAPSDRLPGDRRLTPFRTLRPGDMTSFEQTGEVVATASDYGEATRLLPENRPYRAVDGDPTTSWLTDRRGDARGEVLSLSFDASITEMRLLQPGAPANRRISVVSISADGGPWRRHVLTVDASSGRGQKVELDRPAREVRVRIDETRPIPGTDRQRGVDGVGFSEITTVAGHAEEVAILPTRALSSAGPETPVAIVLTRLRAPAWDPSRSQPETSMRRRVSLPHPISVRVEVRVESSNSTTDVPEVLIDGRALPLIPAGSSGAWTTPEPIELRSGTVDIETISSPIMVDSVELRDVRWATPGTSAIPERLTGTGATRRTEISSCEGPCWLVFAEGWNTGWTARLDGTPLGQPRPVDATGNGWFFPAGHAGGVLELRFEPQRWIDIALWLSMLCATFCIWLCRPRRLAAPTPRDRHGEAATWDPAAEKRPVTTVLLGWTAVAVIIVAVLPFPVGVVVGPAAILLARITGPSRLAEAGLALTTASLVWGWVVIARDRPVARFTWTEATDHLHVPILIGLCLLVGGLLLAPDEENSPGIAATSMDVDGDH
jgi:arabinofuranan 3-O-arabinosyltransferase